MTNRAAPATPTQRPRSTGAVWALALGASVALHAAALFGVPRMDLSGWVTPEPVRLTARIVPAPEPVAVKAPAPVAAAPAVQPRPKPQPRPQPVARKPAPAAPAAPAAAALAPPAPPPEPAPTEVVTAPVAEPQVAAAPDVASSMADTAGAATAEPPAAAMPLEGAVAAASQAVEPSPAPTAAAPASASPLGNVHYPIRRAEIVYDLRWGANPVKIGTVRHRFAVDGEQYQAETVAEATGVFAMLYGGQYVQRSRGRLGPQGLVPEEYFVMRGKPERAERATFDWSTHKVAFTRRDEKSVSEVPSGVQDPISMLHQLYFFQPLPEIAFLDIATSRKVGSYEYERVGREMIETPLGIVDTVHLVRVDEDADRLELWLDPLRGYLPIKLYFRDRKGTIFEQTARGLDVVPAEHPTGPPAQATRLSADR